MEEVDNIIIHTLRQLGCNVPDEVTSLRNFTSNMVVEAASKCLNFINVDANLPTSLPPSMSAKFRVGTSLATACVDLGYSGEIGYQTFLYSNEHELRKVYMFLLEKLPKESSHSADEPLGSAVLLNKKIASEIKRQLSLSWTPYHNKRDKIGYFKHPSNHMQSSFYKLKTSPIQFVNAMKATANSNSSLNSYYEKHFRPFTYQPSHTKDVAASVLELSASLVTAAAEWENEWNNVGLVSRLTKEEYKKQKRKKLLERMKKEVIESKQRASVGQSSTTNIDELLTGTGYGPKKQNKGSRFTHAEQLIFAQDGEKTEAAAAGLNKSQENTESSEEERQRQREEELDGLRETLTTLNKKLEEVHVTSKNTADYFHEVAEQDSVLGQQIQEQENLYRVKKKTVDLLPDAAQNIAKLEQLLGTSAQRLVNLAAQWEKHRSPLVHQYRELKASNEVKESELEEQIREIKSIREKMREAADEVRLKEELQRQLTGEYESMGKDTNRSVYTRRILEIVSNIKRQKEDINKVLLDTKVLQKDINSLSGKLDRTFTVTDELVFKDAIKDEFNRKTYKLLAVLHESFEVLVKAVEETGVTMRDIRDIEEQIDSIKENEDQDSYQQLIKDLKQMKQENLTLGSKLPS